MSEPIPMVRCRLDAPEEDGASAVRYVPVTDFGLWRYLMEGRHGRRVTVEQVSIWLPEDVAARWNSFVAEDLEPVLRVRFDLPGPRGVPVPVERFFPAETYPKAQEALLSHFNAPRVRVAALPGYFVSEDRSGARTAA